MAFFFLPYQTFGSTIMAILTKNTRQNIVNCYSDSHDFFFQFNELCSKNCNSAGAFANFSLCLVVYLP